MSLALQLQLLRGGQVIREEQFDSRGQRAVKIGSADHADLALRDSLVSPFHAVVELFPGQAVLRDLGSRAGTWWNGQRVTEAHLRHGDTIALGTSTLRVGLAHRPDTRPLRHGQTSPPPLHLLPMPPLNRTPPPWAPPSDLSRLPPAAVVELEVFIAFLRHRYGGAPAPESATIAANDVVAKSDDAEEDVMQDHNEACATAVPEKYDTRYLVRQMHRRERRSHFALAALAGAGVAAVWLLATADGRRITERAAQSAAAHVPQVQSATSAVAAPLVTEQAPAAVAAPAAYVEYAVLPGDTLVSISERVLGDRRLVFMLAEANREGLPDPSRLEVGMRLRVPRRLLP